MRANDVMSTGVVTVGPDTPLIEAVRLMLQDEISGLPVVDANGRLVGIVTEGDLLRRHEIGTERYSPRWIEAFRMPALAEAFTRAHGRKVSDVMTSPVVTADPEASLSEIVDAMEKRQVNRVPVLQGENLVGIVSRADLLRAFAHATAAAPPPPAGDAAIQEKLWQDLSKQPWTLPATVSIVIRDGRIDLRGAVPDERYRHALKALAENVVGLSAVEDHLVTVPEEALKPPMRNLAKFLPATDGPGLNVQD
ncbi:MAG TPA: CBS domain-containing protein [Stellaceae bacterium]|nr:CBS domain-containing protein [Stellaceae bacterium]